MWRIHGKVQGVGFRAFAIRHAVSLKLTGWVRNLDDGRVEVYAVGISALLNQFAGALHLGPNYSEVRGVEEEEASVQQLSSFEFR